MGREGRSIEPSRAASASAGGNLPALGQCDAFEGPSIERASREFASR